jgi:hypothetical protein
MELIGRPGGTDFDEYTRFAYIAPGTSLITSLTDIDNNSQLQLTGDEILTLKQYTGASPSSTTTTIQWWGWKIESGSFYTYSEENPGVTQRWTESTTLYLDSDPQTGFGVPEYRKLTDFAIRITAYNESFIYSGNCVETVIIEPPFVPGTGIRPCIKDIDFTCVDGFPVYPIGVRVLCVEPLESENPCGGGNPLI